jgi:membrane protease YdiL (CAAX protease family)
MQDEGVRTGSGPALTSRAASVWCSLALLAAALVVSVPAYTGLRSDSLALAYRFGLPALWGLLALAATRIDRLRPARAAILSLFGVSLGFGLAYLVGDRPLERLGLSADTPQGAAVAKLSEAIPQCAAILLATFLAGRGLRWLGLRKGRLWLSLGLGLLSAVPLLAFLALVPGAGVESLRTVPPATLLSWLPWIVLFSAANGFMEELWFRGSWLSAFGELIGSRPALHVTSLAFSGMHVLVYWSEPAALVVLWPVFLYLGYACALIVRKSGSLWGAVFGHFLADFMFVLVAFASSSGL